MARINVYVPDALYEWWATRAPDLSPSDFVREGLFAERARREGCAHTLRTCSSCGEALDDVRTPCAHCRS